MNAKFRRIPHLKCMGKLGATKDFISPTESLQKICKNSWWFIITKYFSIDFSECLKALECCGEAVEKIANYQFFFMLFKTEIEGSGADSKQLILASLTTTVSKYY